MFTQTWKKYLPVITILLKRSVHSEQSLNMNLTDFERAAGGRKIKFSFTNLQLNNGRINSSVQHSLLAKELGMLLQEDEQTRKLIQKKQFEFSMTNDFQLTIKNITPPEEPVEETVADETVPEEVEENAAAGTETDITSDTANNPGS